LNRLIAFFIGILGFSTFAQGEANNWYFGINAGITFNTNPPSVLTDGQLRTNEGCSSISDPNGNLVMYTDGRTIWNRNHQIMPNADYFGGTGLNGDPSSTSSGLIVPHPTNPDLYFVFTIDEPHHENAYAYPNQGPANSNGVSIPFYTDTGNGIPQDDDGFNNGLNYSIVDISLDGGLGDVITGERNNELITYDPDDSEEIKFKASEKITAVRGGDCNSVWVITHFRNTFYAFFFDADGIDEVPVTSTVPPLLEISNYRRAALGYLKASPNADKLLIAHNTTNFDPEAGISDEGDGNVYAYDFDNLTGVVTNPVELISNVNAYGVEFSQDGTKAYATVNDTSDKIYQWDLSSTDVPNSITSITNLSVPRTALQLGPDGKIYHSIFGEPRLGVINNPDEEGNSVDYTQTELNGALSLNGRVATFGLPPFIQSLFSKRIPIANTPEEGGTEQVALCDTYTYTLSYEDIPGATYTWSRDGEVLTGETDFFLDINVDETADFPIQENYRLEVDLNNGECPLIGIARLIFNESPNYDDVDLTTCRNQTSGIPEYDLSTVTTLLSQNNDILEEEIELVFYTSEADALSGINPLDNFPIFQNVNEFTSLFAQVKTYQVCEEIIEIKLFAEEFPDLFLQDESLTLCQANSNGLILDAGESEDGVGLEYFWSNGETSPQITVNSGGQYTVEVNIQGSECILSKTFTVKESSIASFDHKIERNNNRSSLEVIVDPSSLGEYEFAIGNPVNFQDSPVFENLSPGIYQVFVRDKLGCGLAQKTIGVLGVMEFFTPNGDGINEVWQISGLLNTNEEDILLQVYDRFGKLLKSFTNRDRGWDGTYNGTNMPTDDYWYRVRLTDGTVETGNFTLKR
jgi:gliding motility-associated-like protein